MSAPDPELVRRTARLARLEITDEEARSLGADFARILAQFERLSALDLEDAAPTAGAAGLRDVTRPDEPRPSLAPDDVLAGAPAREDDCFRVPKTVGGEG